MTAAADATHLRPHPLARGGLADPRTALHVGTPPSPPAEVSTNPSAVPVISAFTDVARGLPVHAYAKGDLLYQADAPAAALYYLEAGLVALELNTPKPRIGALAGPGDVIGALMPGCGGYLESAVALSGEVAVRVLDERARAELPAAELATLIARAAGARLAALTQALEDGEHPVPARVARAFLRLGSRFGQGLADGTVRLTLPVTHDTLAAMVGAARETTTAVVADMRRLGLLEGTRGSYRMRPAELAEYALEATLSAT